MSGIVVVSCATFISLAEASVVFLSRGLSSFTAVGQNGTASRNTDTVTNDTISSAYANSTFVAAISGLSFRIRLQSNEISVGGEAGETGNVVLHFLVFPTVESVIEREIIQPLLYDCFVISTL